MAGRVVAGREVSGLLTLALCLIGITQSFTGLEVAETCLFGDAQDFDGEYFDAHRQEWPWPPYSSPCTAEYDMVPGWVNPAIAVTAALCATSLAGLVVVRGARSARRRDYMPPAT
jgi:hypothetical protein